MKKSKKTIGIILAGGTGTRLRPMTLVTNKHLLPIYDKPMIYYPIEMLVNAGVTEIILVVGPDHAGSFMEIVGDGNQFGAEVTFKLQKTADGIAGALRLCESLAGDNNVVVALGDNIFDRDATFNKIKNSIENFSSGAHVFLHMTDNPERFGVAMLKDNGDILTFIEKPKKFVSSLAVTGLYIYDSTLWEKVRSLEKSSRGEYEIIDIQNLYLSQKQITYSMIGGYWSDAGTPESLLESSNYVRSLKDS